MKNLTEILRSYFQGMDDFYSENLRTTIDITQSVKVDKRVHSAQSVWLNDKLNEWCKWIENFAVTVANPQVTTPKQSEDIMIMKVTLIIQGGLINNILFHEVSRSSLLNGIKADIAKTILAEHPFFSGHPCIMSNFSMPITFDMFNADKVLKYSDKIIEYYKRRELLISNIRKEKNSRPTAEIQTMNNCPVKDFFDEIKGLTTALLKHENICMDIVF